MVVFDDREGLCGALGADLGVRLTRVRRDVRRRLVARARATAAALRRLRPIPGQSRPYGLHLERVPADAVGACDGEG